MRKGHGKDISINRPFIQRDLSIVLKKSDQHAVIGTALTFQMVFFCFCSFYSETGVRNPFLFISALLVQKVLVWGEDDFFLSRIIPRTPRLSQG